MGKSAGKATAVHVGQVLVFWTIMDNKKEEDGTSASEKFHARGKNLMGGTLIPGAPSVQDATAILQALPKWKWKNIYFLGHGAPGAFIFRYRGGYANNFKGDVIADPNTLIGYDAKYGIHYRNFINALADQLHPSQDEKNPNVVGFLSCYTGDGSLVEWVYDTLKTKKDGKTGKPKFPHLVVGGYKDYYRVHAVTRANKILYWLDRIVRVNSNTGTLHTVVHPKGRNKIPKFQVEFQ